MEKDPLPQPSPADLNTTDVVKRVQQGETGRFSEIYGRVAPAVYAWAALHVPPKLWRRLDPEDVVQEVWCRALERIRGFDPDKGCFRGWIFGIASHVVLKALRSYRARPERPVKVVATAEGSGLSEVPDDGTSVSRRVARDEQLRAFIAKLAELPVADRTLLILRGLEGREHAEVAKLLGISEDATRKRWDRLRERIAALAPPADLIYD